jgi:beta-fructofuranosidase
MRWERRGVALEADARWYEAAGDVHWRDPWLWEAADGRLRMLLTARARTGPLALRGVLGTATSPDGERWEAGPPASAPGELFQLEVPQLVPDGSRWHVLFSSTERDVGSHHLTGPSPYGPFTLAPGPFLLGGGDWYAARAIEHRGESRLLAWRLRDDSGGFGGWLGDPMPLALGRGDR